MTIAIEQLIKMHDPRCMSIESLNVGRGRAALSKEQILAAFATTQHCHSIGFDLLMAKYRHDSQAEQRIRVAISHWVNTRTHLMYSDPACQLALSMDAVNVPRLSADTQRIKAATAKLKAETEKLTAESKDVTTPLTDVVRDIHAMPDDGMLAQ
ncbi:TIGR02642 family protein [Pectobacterium carotovorum]|uniref:TIGR02642 family protein n=1 Tax=Pectobacterium carotovorum TaxID=554 RepID=UPI003018B312